ncbi:hypothetical protein [Sorangium sp. So ce233]|uniref:hypothetical protein n=1 Tax=Sorangium sp. So ce233 TaxID=3133290 RepID=UPI003F5FC5D0
MRMMVAMMAAVLSVGCSIVDPGDREDLFDQLSSLPPDSRNIMQLWACNRNAAEWFRKRDPNDTVARLYCRTPVGDDWTTWDQYGESMLVKHMLHCLRAESIDGQYRSCIEAYKRIMMGDAAKEAAEAGVDKYECDFVVEDAYQSHRLPQNAVDPETITPDDMIDAMIPADMPPPLPGGLPGGIVLKLCPLAQHPETWGCPDTPGGPPGHSPGENPPGGDYP